MGVNRQCLETFKQAWACQDFTLLEKCISSDVVYHASIGPEPGKSYRGKASVLDGIKAMIAHDNAYAKMYDVIETENTIVWCWDYFDKDTHLLIAKGCDIFHFKAGLICKKDAFRKVWYDQ